MVSHAILVKFLVPWPTGYPLAGQACHRSTSTSICHTTDGRRWRLRLIRFSEGNSHLFLHACDCVTPWSIYHVGIFLLVGHQNEICQTRMWNWRTCFFTACQFKLMLLHSTNHSNWFLKFPVFLIWHIRLHFRQRLRLDPRMFGCPNRRARCWRICYLPSSKQWSCKFSLQELAGKLLAPMNVPLSLDFTCFWSLPADEADRGDLFETDLSECHSCHLTSLLKSISKYADEICLSSWGLSQN